MICLYDVETTGMPLWGRDPLDPNQPRLLQLGAIMADLEWNEILSMRLIVQPDGWMVPDATDQATIIHGISHEMAVRYGIPIKAVLVPFLEMVKRCRYLISYSANFDKWFVDSELKRLGSDDPGVTRPGVRSIDVMRHGSIITGGRWPKLKALYRELFGEDYEGAHDGLHDARATMRCAKALVDRKLIEL
jgi:DNA polymerase-3 subunit epsilon